MKRVLVLGAGLVSKPLVRYLLEQPDLNLHVASRTVSKAEALVDGHPRGSTSQLDVNNKNGLAAKIKGSDAVVSLLPNTYHVEVARICLDSNAHLITTSYLSPEMRALDSHARDRRLLFLNEIGLDPGIDHMSAMQIIDTVKREGGSVSAFESCCGGLPAPEANDNPFGYKFSWSPRGVLLAGRNSARYLKEGKEIVIPGDRLFHHFWQKPVPGLGELEVYPNRESLLYSELYGLEGAGTLFRGTFRNPGWCETLACLAALGYLDDSPRPEWSGRSYAEITAALVNGGKGDGLREHVASFLDRRSDDAVLDRLMWLGLLSHDAASADPFTCLDALAQLMVRKMSFANGERDMIVLQHDFSIRRDDGSTGRICATMIDYGKPDGDSAMARTVSLPAAVAVRLLLQDQISLRGVRIPVDAELYRPVLSELANLGIE